MTRRNGMILAAIDLGSNSFRLEIGRVAGVHIERVGYWKENVRLAAGIDASNRLTARAATSAFTCLARMNERLRGMSREQVRAVGTATLRQVANGPDFLREARRVLGFPIEIISGREEARLVFEGCTRTLPASRNRRLVVDIGGASTEVIVGRGTAPAYAESCKVGCVNTTLRFFPQGRIDRASLRRAVVACAAELEEAQADVRRHGWDEAHGSSGTIGAVSVILRNRGWTDGTVTAEGLRRLRAALVEVGDVRRVSFAEIKRERAEVLVGGVAALSAVFDTFGVGAMVPARGALRAGLLYDLLGRREDHDVRDRTVQRWQARYGVDAGLARRVANTAERFVRALLPGIGPEALQELRFASELHEIGLAVSHSEHHKHAAYLVRNGDLAGFSETEQEAIATLVMGHRGNLRKVIDALWDPVRSAQLLALRLAALFHHARREVPLPRWQLRAGRSFELRIDGRWLEHHPLTRHLLDEEVEHWARVGIRLGVRAI